MHAKRTAKQRREFYRELHDATTALNSYKQESLRECWIRGFNDSYRDVYEQPNGRVERVAYGRGWNARRDVRNEARFPVIHIPSEAVMHAISMGDGAYCEGCGWFIPSGENTRAHAAGCSYEVL
jgi:hypothetical protein